VHTAIVDVRECSAVWKAIAEDVGESAINYHETRPN
jgi:hypothetical protein